MPKSWVLYVHLKAAIRRFFRVKNYPKYIFEKIHNQPVFKTIYLLSSTQNGKLVIMFLIPVVLVDFHGRFKHVFA